MKRTKLWILGVLNKQPKGNDPFDPWYDKAFGFVVRAATEDHARHIAADNQGDEGHGMKDSPWLNPKHTTCEELLPTGEVGMILCDFKSA